MPLHTRYGSTWIGVALATALLSIPALAQQADPGASCADRSVLPSRAGLASGAVARVVTTILIREQLRDVMESPFVEGFRSLFVVYDPGLSNSLGRMGFLGLKYRF